MPNEQLKFTVKERLLLTNQYRILEKLYPEEASTFEQHRIILENGYELHYEQLALSILENRLSEDECKRVMDILDMYRALRRSYEGLEDKDGINKQDVHFNGFDGNNETALMCYTEFLILKQGRWQEQLEDYPESFHREFNSHSPTTEVYDRMLQVWNGLGRKFEMPAQEIKQVLDARIHPEYRK